MITLSDEAGQVFEGAAQLSRKMKLPTISDSAVFVALCDSSDPDVKAVLGEGVEDLDLLRSELMARMVSPDGEEFDVPESGIVEVLSPEVEGVLAVARRAAMRIGAEAVPPILLLDVLLSATSSMPIQALAKAGVPIGPLRMASRQRLVESAGAAFEAGGEPERPVSALQKFGRDCVEEAGEGRLGVFVGRKDELRRLVQILGRQKKGNALVVGDPGVGKTSLVNGLAIRLSKEGALPAIKDWRIMGIRPAELLAGTGVRGELEDRVIALLEEAESRPEVILFIDDLAQILVGDPTVANLVKAALTRGRLRLVATATTDDYQRAIERDTALTRNLEVLWLEEPEPEECYDILRALKTEMESHHGVSFGEEALKAAVELSRALLPDRRLPDMARDLLDQACSESRLQTLTAITSIEEFQLPEIGRGEVAKVVSRLTEVPVESLVATEAERLLDLERLLGDRVFGQEPAVTALAQAVRTARAGFGDPRRPVGVFIFAGPSGVGKTELAKALARSLFHREDRILQFNMSEYMEPHSVSKLIGSPPGYVGHDQGGLLVSLVRRHPSSVVLFDEVEKAHPRVADLFLQIFDEGVLSDSAGRRANFRNCIVILTTNLRPPEGESGGRMGFGPLTDETAEEIGVRETLKQFFRPEILNRVSEIIPFENLDRDAVYRIIEQALDEIRVRATGQGVTLAVTDSVREHLYRSGYSEEQGARGLTRRVQNEVTHPLAAALLRGRTSGEIPKRINVDLVEDRVQVEVFPD